MVSDLALHTQLNQGYTLYLNAGEDPVKLYKGNDFLSGGTAMSDFTIGEDYSGDKLYVSSGGEISNIVVERNGSALISSGGVANGNTVNSNGNLRVYNGGLASNTTVNAIGRLFVYGGVADNNTMNSKGTVNVSGGVHGNGSNGTTLVDGDIFITVTDSVIGISEGETISYGAIYGRGQQDNDTVMGDSTITLSGVTTVGRVAAKYSGEKESAYYTALILNSFTGVITDSIGSDIDWLSCPARVMARLTARKRLPTGS